MNPLIKWIKINNINNDTPITCKKRMNHPILTSDIIYTRKKRELFMNIVLLKPFTVTIVLYEL